MKIDVHSDTKVQDIFGENAVDVSDEVEVYENGKTMECPDCGSGTGLEKGAVSWKCYECCKTLVDSEWHKREDQEPVEESGGQMKLGEFA